MKEIVIGTGYTYLRDKALRQATLMFTVIQELAGNKPGICIGLTQQDKTAIVEILNSSGATRRYKRNPETHTARISLALRRLGYRFKWSQTESYTICDFTENEQILSLMKEHCEFICQFLPDMREVLNGSEISIKIDI